ncbi:hypothetical protein J2Z69_003377 [Paenibacillus shirakamiensis]|uniref:Uncharacterized protein n=1 Tax=Paenibacillus shirakamiensis TaxID=1265935 RepID=A0ABS4JKR2_9BACL|nr:hypothetical protein [Paenibacillus shirakamiensis]
MGYKTTVLAKNYLFYGLHSSGVKRRVAKT